MYISPADKVCLLSFHLFHFCVKNVRPAAELHLQFANISDRLHTVMCTDTQNG